MAVRVDVCAGGSGEKRRELSLNCSGGVQLEHLEREGWKRKDLKGD